LKEIAKLARILNNEKLKEKLERRAQKLKEDFNQKFWMPEKRYFCLALDGKKNQRRTITSNPGHLLFAGIVDEEKRNSIARRLFEKDMFTPLL